MRKGVLAVVGVALVAAATLIQMVIDWYQSYAYGIPMPSRLKILVILAGVLTLIALILSVIASGRRGQ